MQTRRFLAGMVPPGTDPFRPLEPHCSVVQWNEPLTPAQLERAGELVAGRPDIELYGFYKAATDLDFLQYFPTVRRLHLALYWLEDISGFAHLDGSLEWLNFSTTKKKFSLRFVESLPHLNYLFLVGHRIDLLSVCRLPELTSFGLSGITVDDLAVFLPLKKLRQLYIFWGSATNLAALPRFPELPIPLPDADHQTQRPRRPD